MTYVERMIGDSLVSLPGDLPFRLWESGPLILARRLLPPWETAG
jgi:hypothetical protein